MTPLRATKTIWVSRDKDGQMKAVPVVQMETDHLRRWINYFRKKYTEQRPELQTSVAQQGWGFVDAVIQADMVTAPAIYAEAIKRGVLVPPPKVKAPAPAKAPVPGEMELRRRWMAIVREQRPTLRDLLAMARRFDVTVPVTGIGTVTVVFDGNLKHARDVVDVQAQWLAGVATTVWGRTMMVRTLLFGPIPSTVATAAATTTTVRIVQPRQPGKRHITLEDDEL